MKIDFNILNSVIPKYTNTLHVDKVAGLTNANYLIKTDHATVFYKIYNTTFNKILIDRRFEKEIIRVLPDHPKVLYADNQISIRNYLADFRPINIGELDDKHIRDLNSQLVAIHSLTPDFKDKTPLLKIVLQKNYLKELIAKIRESRLTNIEQEAFVKLIDRIIELSPQLNAYLDKFDDCVRLCHNDLTLGNILVNPDSKQLQLIDFDYANFNPIFYEFGNLFMEMQSEFFEHAPYFRISNETAETREIKQRIVGFYFQHSENFGITQQQFFEICKEFELFANIFWSIVSAESLAVEVHLDFLKYAQFRMALVEQALEDSQFGKNSKTK